MSHEAFAARGSFVMRRMAHRLASTAVVAAPLRRWRRRTPRRRGLSVMPYMGYVTEDTIVVRGRVLRERPGAAETQPEDSAWRNFRALLRLMNSAEVPKALLQAQIGEHAHTASSDAEGYFRFEIPRRDPAPAAIELRLLQPLPGDGPPIVATAPLLRPPASARFGVISDIDDTVVHTDVLNRRRMALMLARTNAHTRLPFPDVAALYRALGAGASGAEGNPIFYVSSSPWNLYTPLAEFLRVNGIPEGPMFLKDWGLQILFHREHGFHKHAAIREILVAYPRLPFVLLGDSGEQDPEIYAQVVHEFPRRIAAVYIRSIDPDPRRHASIRHLTDEVKASGAAFVLAPDSATMARDAAALGLVDPGGWP